MEKPLEGLQEEPSPPQHHSRRRISARFLLIAAVAYIFLRASTIEGTWFPLGRRSSHTHHVDNTAFSWEAVESKPYLEWTQCYDSFQCARLELPMDYFNGTTNATVSIAVIKQPAPVPVTHPQYGGMVLHNPGGPGGSGVGFLLRAGAGLAETVGSPDGLQFDHVSFDPRGIAYTTPLVPCFDDPLVAVSWLARVFEEGLYSSSDAAFGRLWSMAAASSGSCSLPPEDGSADIKQYVNTAFVARDMLEIVEAHGEWREAEAKRLLQHSGCNGRSMTSMGDDADAVMEKLKYRKGEEKINYWGFSYGSYLGNTFAAMFPDRINRLIVDGVVDAYDYRKTLWLDNLVDTDKDLRLLYYHCARVGYPTCALANATGKTTIEGVEARIKNISTALYHNPLPVISRNAPGIVTYSDIKGFLFASLYSPVQLFPIVATILADIEGGAFPLGGSRNQNEALAALFGSGAGLAIACSDGESQNDITKEEYREHVKKLEKLSPALGEVWSAIRLGCIHWKARAHYRFTADWTGKTSHPILEIGNTADPVTPGRFAKKMARGFEGAVALIQDSPGHCSLAAASNCTTTYIRRYFQTGELPEEGTVCAVDEVPFGEVERVEAVDVEVQMLRRRQRVVRDAMYASWGGFARYGPAEIDTAW